MVLLYNIGFHILLLYLVINIVILNYSLFDVYSVIMGLLLFNNIVASIEIIFWDLLLGFNFYASTLFLNKSDLFKDHFTDSITLYSSLVIYGLFAMTIYFVWET